MATPISDFGSAVITGIFLWWQMVKLGKEEKIAIKPVIPEIKISESDEPLRVPD
jgi:hypothetical protein